MKLDTSGWKAFLLSDLFDVKKGKRLTSEDQTDGNTLYIGAIDSNNGVANHIGQDPIHSGNTISLSYNGSVGEAFYQLVPFWATDDVNVLYFKGENNYEFNQYTGLFICAILRMEKYRFSYGRKWTLDNMCKTVIRLPATPDGAPDWDFMESYMKTLHHKPLTTKNKPGNAPELETKKWAFFYIRDIFDITNCYPHDLGNLEEGNVPFIGRTALNNGLQGYVSVPCNEINAPGCISISRVATNIALWQDRPFATSQHITTLRSPHLNIHSGIFICGLLNHEMEGKFSYGRTIGQKDIDSMRLKLPVTSTGAPDWQFMEDYIKALPYGDRV